MMIEPWASDHTANVHTTLRYLLQFEPTYGCALGSPSSWAGAPGSQESSWSDTIYTCSWRLYPEETYQDRWCGQLKTCRYSLCIGQVRLLCMKCTADAKSCFHSFCRWGLLLMVSWMGILWVLVSQLGREDDDMKLEDMGASTCYVVVMAEVTGNINIIKNSGSFDCSQRIQHLRLDITGSQRRTISLGWYYCRKCTSEQF